jgi:hypothetical protein
MPFWGGGHIFRYQLRDSELREATRGSGLMAGFRELSRKVADASALSQLVTWVLRGGYSGVTARAFRIGPGLPRNQANLKPGQEAGGSYSDSVDWSRSHCF